MSAVESFSCSRQRPVYCLRKLVKVIAALKVWAGERAMLR